MAVDTSGGCNASSISPRTVIVGMRSRRRMMGSSARTSNSPNCASGMRWPLAPARVKSAMRLGSSRVSPAERTMTCTVRISSRTTVTGTPVKRNCSCCATSLEVNPIACKRSWFTTKCCLGVREPQSILTVRIMGFSLITRCTSAAITRNFSGSGPLTR